MCMGGGAPSMPKMPDPPEPAPTPPPPAPIPEPEKPAPPPEMVKDQSDAATVKAKKSKRQQVQQASKGANALRIPLNTGAALGKAKGSLNIPT